MKTLITIKLGINNQNKRIKMDQLLKKKHAEEKVNCINGPKPGK